MQLIVERNVAPDRRNLNAEEVERCCRDEQALRKSLELAKPYLYNDDDPARQAATRRVLAEVFGRLLRIMHPLMPFVSEELWQRLPSATGSVMQASWPQGEEGDIDPAAEEQMAMVMEVIGAVRNIRGEMGISPGQRVPVVLSAQDAGAQEFLQNQTDQVANLAKAGKVTWAEADQPPAKAAGQALGRVSVYVPLEGLVDFSAEQKRLSKQIAKLNKDLEGTRRKLSNQGFLDKAPAAVKEKQQKKLVEGESKLERLGQNLKRIESFL